MFRKKYTDAQLVRLIQAKEQAADSAFHQLMITHDLKGLGLRIARKKGANQEQAEEVASIALATLFQAIAIKKNYQEQGQLKGFFVRIVNRCWSRVYHEEKKRMSMVTSLSNELSATQAAPKKEGVSREEMQGYMRQVGDSCRSILLLNAEKIPHTHIAEILRLKDRHTVKSRVAQCRKKLRRIIDAASAA